MTSEQLDEITLQIINKLRVKGGALPYAALSDAPSETVNSWKEQIYLVDEFLTPLRMKEAQEQLLYVIKQIPKHQEHQMNRRYMRLVGKK